MKKGFELHLVASSFCNAPGLPVLHSKDLVNWKVINLGFSLDGEHFEDVYLYPAKAGSWVGVKHGVFCYHENDTEAGKVGVEYFHYI